MEVRAEAKYIRISPRKVAIILDQLRGKDAAAAVTMLSFLPQKAADKVLRVLRSAIANAKNNYHLPEAGLYISRAIVGGGPMLKRFQPVSRGRAHPIKKRSSHITVCVSERAAAAKGAKK